MLCTLKEDCCRYVDGARMGADKLMALGWALGWARSARVIGLFTLPAVFCVTLYGDMPWMRCCMSTSVSSVGNFEPDAVGFQQQVC